jgi:hypothetical protein
MSAEFLLQKSAALIGGETQFIEAAEYFARLLGKADSFHGVHFRRGGTSKDQALAGTLETRCARWCHGSQDSMTGSPGLPHVGAIIVETTSASSHPDAFIGLRSTYGTSAASTSSTAWAAVMRAGVGKFLFASITTPIFSSGTKAT